MEERLGVVTGAASGIGRATALHLLGDGCQVIAVDRDQEGLRSLEASLAPADRRRLIVQPLDVAVWAEVQEWSTRLLEEEGPPQYLVTSAGVNPEVASAADVDERLWDAVIDTNLKGVFACCRVLLPAMAAARRGAVVTISSVSGLVAWGGSSVYGASKAGVIGLSRYLAVEYAPHGVRVNCICPGAVRTPMAMNLWQSSSDPRERFDDTVRHHPLGRVAEADDVVRAIAFLLGDGAAFITGATLTVDGGLTAI